MWKRERKKLRRYFRMYFTVNCGISHCAPRRKRAKTFIWLHYTLYLTNFLSFCLSLSFSRGCAQIFSYFCVPQKKEFGFRAWKKKRLHTYRKMWNFNSTKWKESGRKKALAACGTKRISSSQKNPFIFEMIWKEKIQRARANSTPKKTGNFIEKSIRADRVHDGDVRCDDDYYTRIYMCGMYSTSTAPALANRRWKEKNRIFFFSISAKTFLFPTLSPQQKNVLICVSDGIFFLLDSNKICLSPCMAFFRPVHIFEFMTFKKIFFCVLCVVYVFHMLIFLVWLCLMFDWNLQTAKNTAPHKHV